MRHARQRRSARPRTTTTSSVHSERITWRYSSVRGAALLERHGHRVELLAQPADADAEVDPPAGQVVEVDHLLGRVHGVALGHEADAGAEPDAVGDGGQVGERGERLEQAGVAAAGEPAVGGVGVLRLVVVEQHDVLGHPDRLEAPVLGRAQGPEDLGVGVAVPERYEGADFHGAAPRASAATGTRPSGPLAVASERTLASGVGSRRGRSSPVTPWRGLRRSQAVRQGGPAAWAASPTPAT